MGVLLYSFNWLQTYFKPPDFSLFLIKSPDCWDHGYEPPCPATFPVPHLEILGKLCCPHLQNISGTHSLPKSSLPPSSEYHPSNIPFPFSSIRFPIYTEISEVSGGCKIDLQQSHSLY